MRASRIKRVEDVRVVATVIISVAIVFMIPWLPWKFLSFGHLASVFVLSLVVFCVAVINHNHRHQPIFSEKWLNQSFDFLISIVIGAPSARLHMVHLFNHHVHYKDQRDWTCYRATAKGEGLNRIISYVVRAGIRVGRYRHDLKGLSTALDQSLRRERLALWIFVVYVATTNLRAGLFVLAPAWIFGLGILFVSNLMNHDQCELESRYNHSRDFLSRFENLIFFNNGYHTIHHFVPSAHWADLPLMHNELIAPFKDGQYTENSFIVYFIQSVIPGSRKKIYSACESSSH